MTGPLPLVTVSVLTFRRPVEIDEAIPALLDQLNDVAAQGGYRTELLVIDNDPDGSARAIVDRYRAADASADEQNVDLRNDVLRYVVEPIPGISAGRNRAIDESADSDFLVFIDDDERPAPGWLHELLASQRRTGASAVSGVVVSLMDGELDPWIDLGGFFQRSHRHGLAPDTPIPVAATNNLLLDRRIIADLELRFDADFGLSGGGDSLFTQTLTSRGRQLVWATDAVVTERVPADRLSRRWVLLRALRIGNSAARVDLRLAAPGRERAGLRVKHLTGGLARVAVGLLRAAIGGLTGSLRHRARGMRLAARGVGMAGGAVNWTYHEYRRAAAPATPVAPTTRSNA